MTVKSHVAMSCVIKLGSLYVFVQYMYFSCLFQLHAVFYY